MIIMFINKYSVLAFSMILACLQAATEQDQLEIALALSKAEHEAELKRNDDSMALQRAIEEQNIQKALQDDLETRNSKAAAGYHENEDPELQRAIAESMKKPAATAGHYENEDPELQRAIAESMKKPAATAGHYENEDPKLQQAIAESMKKPAATDDPEEMDEETRAAIALSMQKPVAGTSGGTAEDIVRESRLNQFSSSARSSRAPLSEADLEARVESRFEKEKRAIELQIRALEAKDLTRIPVRNRVEESTKINKSLSDLKTELQNYTARGKIDAKKMQIRYWIAGQSNA